MMNGSQQQQPSQHFGQQQGPPGSGTQFPNDQHVQQQTQQGPQYLLQSTTYLNAFTSDAGNGQQQVVATSMSSTSSPVASSTYQIQSLPNSVEIYAHKDTDKGGGATAQLILQPEQLFHQMQQQYQAQILALQQELSQLRAATANSNKNSTTTSKRSQPGSNSDRPTIVETYCENIQVRQFTCKNCSYKTKSEASLAIHNTNHLVNQRYLHLPTTCFTVRPNRETSPTSYLYPCGECSGKFSHNDLYLHIYQHHTGEAPFHCDECDLFFMHFEFLDDHQRSTHMKVPGKKKPRYSGSQNATTQQSSETSSSPPQLTYYSVVKCSKPFEVLGAISHGVDNSSGDGGSGSWDGTNASEISPMGNYPYHHSAAHKRGRARLKDTSSGPNGIDGGQPATTSLYKCHYVDCFFTADTKDRLDFHLFAHRSSRFKCPYCPYVSNVLNDIKRHVVKGGKHDGQPMFSCPNGCQFTTNDDKSFRDHIRTIHYGKQIDEKSLTSYIEELFVNTMTDPGTGGGREAGS